MAMVKLIATVSVAIFWSHGLLPTPTTDVFALRPRKPLFEVPLKPPAFNDRGVIKIIMTRRYEMTVAVAIAKI